ncbi:cytochrome P450 2J6-like [Paramacrobiotus metropolitanus]|uniref:cytochrome P450 2J6-like n=1 Tax=Paramacrobiotus metropolitanus TaxID=2943436 RepID=UPI00244641C6|nr:cytochrome P450 2J6-like [Paramacrobiotus metropolitanus]
MLTEILSIVAGSAALYLIFYIGTWYLRLSQYRLPPGPLCLPFVGSLLTARFTFFQRQHYDNAKKYGSVVRTQIGPFTTIQLNDPVIIKEAFNRDALVPRPHFWSIEQRNIVNHGATGVVFSKGEMWKEHRRFILSTFRDFGVGKFRMEEKIVAEAGALVTFLRAQEGRPLETKVPLSISVANVIASVLTGARYEMDDPQLRLLLQYTKENFEFTMKKVILAVLPVTRYVPPIREQYRRFMEIMEGLYAFFSRPMKEHLDNFVPDRNADFLESYISAVKSGQYSTLSTTEIPLLLEDLFEAGFETTTTTLRWALLMMALHPDIQQRVQFELDRHVNAANGEFATPSDKLDTPYVEATLMEAHRYASVVPMGVNHCAQEDIQIEGYDVPKGAWVQANIYFVHHNDAWWDEPESFKPERFLKDGQVQPSDNLMPFGLGKRRCLGEALARAELFILFTAIVQRFEIRLPEGVAPADVDLTPTSGITADTQPHRLCFLPRI